MLPICAKSSLYLLNMTTHYQSNDGILTNNDSESYNSRMRKKIGNHPNFPTVIGVLREENTLVEIDWLQRDREFVELLEFSHALNRSFINLILRIRRLHHSLIV